MHSSSCTHICCVVGVNIEIHVCLQFHMLRVLCVTSTSLSIEVGETNTIGDNSELIERLNSAFVDMEKATKGITKIYNMGNAVDDKPAKLVVQLEETENSMQKVEMLASDIGYMLKYRKDKHGNKATINSGKVVIKEASASLADLLLNGKALKALIPSKKKESV